MDERLRVAFELAFELSVQLITLAAAILVLSISLAKELYKKKVGSVSLILTWIGFCFSILFGFLALMAITGSLDPMESEAVRIVHIGGNVRFFAGVQVILFGLSTVLFTVIGCVAIWNRQRE